MKKIFAVIVAYNHEKTLKQGNWFNEATYQVGHAVHGDYHNICVEMVGSLIHTDH